MKYKPQHINASEGAQKKRSPLPDRFPLGAAFFCLALCFLFGVSEVLAFHEARPSESEKRMLQGFPALTAENLVSGDFMSELESYLSDSFPYRDGAAKLRDTLTGVFSLGEAQPTELAVDDAMLDIAPEAEREEEKEPSLPSAAVSPEEETELPGEASERSVTVDAALLDTAEFYVEDAAGNRRTVFSLDPEQLASYAEIMNLYRSALPEDGSLHFIVPLYSGLVRSVTDAGFYTTWGSDLEDELSKVTAEGVYVYDVLDILEPCIGKERLYPTDDIHWLPFAASRVADTLLEAQGVPAMGYEEYRYRIPGVSGSGSVYGEALRSARFSPDIFPAIVPASPVEAYRVSRFTEREPDLLIDSSYTNAYSYLGGLRFGPWRLFETGFHTGRRAMLVTDSFGWSLTPYLLPYYDEVLYVDLRGSCYSPSASGGSIHDYIDFYEIDDIYMVYSAYNNIPQVQKWLLSYFE